MHRWWKRLVVALAALGFVAGLSAQTVRSPHGSGLTIPCANCHTTTSWSPLRAQPEFNHDRETHFPLRGMHVSVNCSSCHVSKNFADAGTSCASCHADFHRRQFGARCEDCHSVRGWRVAAQAVNDHRNRFPLLGAHAAAACDSCHRGAAAGVYIGLTTRCDSCHLPQYQNTQVVNHRSANFPTTCETCHNVETWQTARFDHNRFTRFALTGLHSTVACASCHVGGRYQTASTDCFSCHSADFGRTTNPNHVAAGFPRDCASCHNTATWQGASFNHSTLTKFALTGAHANVACSSCHVGGQFSGTAQACIGCHVADFERTKDPDHRSAGFATQCENCHTTVTWDNAKFDHNLSRFTLTGAHVSAKCEQCHINGKFTGTSNVCLDCHQAAFQATSAPPHVASGFPTDCSLCHTTAQWQGATFDHSRSRFPLTGKHSATTCAQCHSSGQYATLPTTCVNCHQTEFQNTKNPNHVAAAFSPDCQLCHTTIQWTGAVFDHSKTKFQLTGKHSTATCQQCHSSGQYATLPTTCVNCHQSEYQNTKNPNHVAASFPQDCQLCHTSIQWTGAVFDHSKTRFQLTGKHSTATCQQCHASGQYATLPAACATCHQAEFQSSKNPNHIAAGFPQDCQVCHTTVQWTGARFDHNVATKFPLTGKHIVTNCIQCHAGNRFAGSPTDCAGCHLTDFQKTTNPNHVSANFSTACVQCHTTAQWQGSQFDHGKTKFPLAGKHAIATCQQCHSSGQYATLPTGCVNCHQNEYLGTKTPNHVAASFPTDCGLCHTSIQWAGATFDHNKTKFPLAGKHSTATCQQCHSSGQYATLPTACVNCHQSEYQGTKNPNHVAAGFPTDCALCHTSIQWTGAIFDHSKTRFPLSGKHSAATCQQCHSSGQYATLPTTCVTCHQTDFQNTKSPNHTAAGFSTDCQLCHTTTQWTGAVFDHSKARFPLTGKHSTVTCQQCHSSGQYATLPTTCVSCHLTNYQNSKSPSHVAAGFPQDCQLCHTTAQWTGAIFDHSKVRFPLTGKHTTVTCAQCHSSGQYATLPTTCVSCHLANYQNSKNPNHVAAGFPQDCQLCHTTAQWPGAKFDHSTATRFPLTGKHTTVACATCHINNQFATLPTTCVSCHLAKYQATTNPNHVTAGFPTDCALCHTTAQWPGATFNHGATRFPLSGKHTTLTCAQCHSSGQYATLPTTCVSCHLAKYQATTNPNHAAAGFPQDCSLCHTTAQWPGATFNHTATKFPLTGKHTTLTCAQCHSSGQYATLPTTCVSCHLAKYQATTNPNHVTAGFPQDCSLCHSTAQWPGATFNHSTTAFPLTGKHTTVQCAQCHVNGVYKGTTKDCYTCHTAAYNNTTNPNHKAAGFPTTCATCHTTAQWTGATFNHTWFPITSGNHKVACATCHTNPANYAVFSCTSSGCHTKTTTDNHHQGVRNYIYNSINCYSCHPSGRAG